MNSNNNQQKHTINLAGDCMPRLWKELKWIIDKHVSNGTFELDSSQLKLHFSPNQIDEKCIEGEKLRKELESNKVSILNACVLDYLLLHPELIPEDWKVDENGNTRYIFFWGTVYLLPHNGERHERLIRYLYWDDGAWNWSAGRLVDSWDFRHPAAVLASAT